MPVPTREAALAELEDVAQEISNLHLQLAELLHAEHNAKTRSWFDSNSQYVTERDRIAEFNALDLTLDIIKLRGELAAADSRRSFLTTLIQWSTDGRGTV